MVTCFASGALCGGGGCAAGEKARYLNFEFSRNFIEGGKGYFVKRDWQFLFLVKREKLIFVCKKH